MSNPTHSCRAWESRRAGRGAGQKAGCRPDDQWGIQNDGAGPNQLQTAALHCRPKQLAHMHRSAATKQSKAARAPEGWSPTDRSAQCACTMSVRQVGGRWEAGRGQRWGQREQRGGASFPAEQHSAAQQQAALRASAPRVRGRSTWRAQQSMHSAAQRSSHSASRAGMASTLPHSGGSVPVSRVLLRSLHRVGVWGKQRWKLKSDENGRVRRKSQKGECNEAVAATAAPQMQPRRQQGQQACC